MGVGWPTSDMLESLARHPQPYFDKQGRPCDCVDCRAEREWKASPEYSAIIKKQEDDRWDSGIVTESGKKIELPNSHEVNQKYEARMREFLGGNIRVQVLHVPGTVVVRCNCSCADACPLGKTGMEERCTIDELEVGSRLQIGL